MSDKKITIKQIHSVEMDTFLRDGYLVRDNTHPEGKYFPPHNHDHFEIEIISDGCVIHDYNDLTFNAKTGHAYICTYNDIHSIKYLEEAKIFNIRLSEGFIDPQLALVLLSPAVSSVCYFNPEELSYIMTIAQTLKREQLNKPDFYNIRAKSLISDIIIMILRKSSENSVQIPSDNTLKATSIIIKNFKNPITLADIANELKLSPDHLGKLLKHNTGLSFNEFVNTLRIRHACNLLINSDLSVKEIAFACGYNSVEYFMRCFKKLNSKTPIEYKNTHLPKI